MIIYTLTETLKLGGEVNTLVVLRIGFRAVHLLRGVVFYSGTQIDWSVGKGLELIDGLTLEKELIFKIFILNGIK